MAFGQDTQYWLDWYANAATAWGPDSSYVQRVMASAGVAIPTEVKQEATVSYQTQLVESATASAAEAGVTVEEWASAYVTAGGIVPPRAEVIIQTPEYQEWVATQTPAELEEVYTSQTEASADIRAEQEATGQAAIATSNALQALRDAGTTFTPDEGGAIFDATYSEVFDTISAQQAAGVVSTSEQQAATARAIMAEQIAIIRAAAIGGIPTTGIIPTTETLPLIAGFDLGSSWPILAIVGVGALMMFKKEPGSRPKRKGGRRRK